MLFSRVEAETLYGDSEKQLNRFLLLFFLLISEFEVNSISATYMLRACDDYVRWFHGPMLLMRNKAMCRYNNLTSVLIPENNVMQTARFSSS